MYLKNTCNQFNGANTHVSGSGSGFGQDLSLCNGDPWQVNTLTCWKRASTVPLLAEGRRLILTPTR